MLLSVDQLTVELDLRREQRAILSALGWSLPSEKQIDRDDHTDTTNRSCRPSQSHARGNLYRGTIWTA
jgi:hypothetical protein